MQEFKEYDGIQTKMKSSAHHNAIGEKSSRLLKNAAKIIKIITEQGNPFAVVPENICRDIEDRDNF